MELQKAVSIGEINFVIITPDSPNHYLSKKQDLELVNAFKNAYTEILNSYSENCRFELEIIDIHHGCLRAKLKVWITVVTLVGSALVYYPELKAGTAELISDLETIKVSYVLKPDENCRTNTTGMYTTKTLVYGPVQKGETLFKISEEIKRKYPNYSKEQIAITLFKKNKNDFIDNNINKLKEGAVLYLPNHPTIVDIDNKQAKEELDKLLKKR